MPTEKAIVYRVHNMHGPTVFQSDHAGFEELCAQTQRASRNSGPYRIVYLPTGETVASFRDGLALTPTP